MPRTMIINPLSLHKQKRLEHLQEEIEQILGRALGYPWYKDDQDTFPGATEEDGVCIGDMTVEALADQAATRIATQQQRIAALEDALQQIANKK